MRCHAAKNIRAAPQAGSGPRCTCTFSYSASLSLPLSAGLHTPRLLRVHLLWPPGREYLRLTTDNMRLPHLVPSWPAGPHSSDDMLHLKATDTFHQVCGSGLTNTSYAASEECYNFSGWAFMGYGPCQPHSDVIIPSGLSSEQVKSNHCSNHILTF